MKGCELCPATAWMHCESDQARLCFECDAKVHGANFLVARHSRVLLCRSCQAPTPWKAAGPRLTPTISVCERCVCGGGGGGGGGRSAGKNQEEHEGESGERRDRVGEEEDNGGDGDGDDEDEDEMEEDRESEEEEEEEEGEEQVVPWTAEPPPVASSSSSEEESGGRICGGLLKRMRGDVDLPPSSSCSQDQLPSSASSRLSYLPNRTGFLSPVRTAADDEATSDSFRSSKECKKLDLIRAGSHGFSAITFSSARPPI